MSPLDEARKILALPAEDIGTDEQQLAATHALVSIADSLATIATATRNAYSRGG
ncbi:MAG TPA: hypothetical protein VGG84_10305 [Gemmatimonadaceae bacterium]|jgi:hypothetical protein